ncbi:MAG: tetratricopeptide repeat protein [Phycisphaerae bacterium]
MTQSDRFELAASVFIEACQIPQERREQFVANACAEDAEVLRLVEKMILADAGDSVIRSLAEHFRGLHDRMRGGDDAATLTLGAHMAAPIGAYDEQPNDRIGRFRLLELIGEGGFGRVWVAEQREPVQRRVALKVIKAGMDTREVVARFEQERQALALMDHANIAKVFDAGVTANGRPFFVMELCKGEPIADYCDAQSLSIAERLELFAQVCTAVQHAHTKGVIHRDIKPSNVLVSTQDGRPHAKIIDFGIAKAIDTRLTEKTLFTEHRQLIGTPAYMSPEQAEGSLDIDTRTDVYSLGVLLYQLLTGSTPFSGKELRSAAYDEMRRIIREVEPPSPSTRLSENATTIGAVAASRRSEPRKLGTLLRGELDWIVMKALEKDRARRYESASGLADDVRRYLHGEPVIAAPPSRSYQLRKFVRRHRGVVLAGAFVSAALLLGVIGTSVGLVWALQEKSRADFSARSEQIARLSAQKRGDELKAVADFQARMLSRMNGAVAGSELMQDVRERFAAATAQRGATEAEQRDRAAGFERELSLINATDVAVNMIDRTILAPAIRAVDEGFKDNSLVDAALRSTLADIYRVVARHETAISLQRQALETRRAQLGDDHADTLASIAILAKTMREAGDLPAAETFAREASDGQRRVFGDESADALASRYTLALVLRDQGRLAESEKIAREVEEIAGRIGGEDNADRLNYLSLLGIVVMDSGRQHDAEPLLREALERSRRVNGDEHPDTIKCMNNYGNVLRETGRRPEAEALAREALERMRKARGDAHPDTLIALNNLASVVSAQGRLAESETLHREAVEKSRRVLGSDHPDTLRTISNLANVLRGRNNPQESEPLALEALEGYRRVLGRDHRETLIATNVYGYALVALKRAEEAEPYWREAFERGRRMLGEDHPDVIVWMHNLGGLLDTLGRAAESEPFVHESLARTRRVNGPVHPITLHMSRRASSIFERMKRSADAEAALRDLVEGVRRELGPEHTDALRYTFDLADYLRRAGCFDESEAMFRDIINIRIRELGEDDPPTANVRVSFAKVLIEQRRWSDAADELLEAHGVLTAAGDTQPARMRACIEALVTVYEGWHADQPDRGFDQPLAHWRARMSELKTEPAAPQ